MAKTPEFKFVCCAVDCGDACEDEGVYRIPPDLMNRAAYSSGGGYGRSLRFDTRRADDFDRCYVCGEHAMQTMLSVFGRGLAEGKSDLNPRLMLVRLGAWLDFTERGLTPDEIANRTKKDHPAQSVGDEQRKAYKVAILDAVHDCNTKQLAALDLAEREGPRRSPRGAPAPDEPEPEPVAEPVPEEAEIVLLLRSVLEHDLLPDDTRTFGFIITALRHLHIAAGVEFPPGTTRGTKWGPREAKEIIRFILQHPSVFTAKVLDTLHGIGMLGMGSRDRGKCNLARLCSVVPFPSYESIKKFKPRATGSLLEPNAGVAAKFAELAWKLCPEANAKGRLVVALSVDKSDGSGDASFHGVRHLVDGLLQDRIIGFAAKPDGTCAYMNAEDAAKLLNISDVEAANGVETCLLHLPNGALRGGFLAGLVPVRDEKCVASLFRRWRAFLIPHHIELLLLAADYGGSNRKAIADLNGDRKPPKSLPKPAWTLNPVPSFEEMISETWNHYYTLYGPDVVEHIAKHFMYAHYDKPWQFGPGATESGTWGDLIWQLTGAREVRGPHGALFVCSRPGDASLARVRDAPLSDKLAEERVEDYHREVRGRVGAQHLGVTDPQHTGRAMDVAGLYELLDEVGEHTASRIAKAVLQLRQAARGRDLDDSPLPSPEATIVAGKAAVEVLDGFQKIAERNGRAGNDRRPRGGWPPETIEAAKLAVSSAEIWCRWNRSAGVTVALEWVSSRWNEVLHSFLKRDGGRYLDLDVVQRQGESYALAQTLRAADPQHPAVQNRKGVAYALLAEHTADANKEHGESFWERRDESTVAVKRRAPVPLPAYDDDETEQGFEDTTAELYDRSASGGLSTSMRDRFVKGCAAGRTCPKSKRVYLTAACMAPSSIASKKPSIYSFKFDVTSTSVSAPGVARLYASVPGVGPFMKVHASPSTGRLRFVLEFANSDVDVGARATRASTRAAERPLRTLETLSLSFEDVIAMVFSDRGGDGNSGATSIGVTDVTLVLDLTDDATVEPPTDATPTDATTSSTPEIIVVTARLQANDLKTLTKLVHVPALQGTAVDTASTSEVSSRARVVAAARALLLTHPDAETGEADDAAGGDALTSAAVRRVFAGLGEGWTSAASPSRAAAEFRGLGDVAEKVAKAVSAGACPPLASYADERLLALGSRRERTDRARAAHARHVPDFASFPRGTKVVVRLPSDRLAEDADAEFYGCRFLTFDAASNRCYVEDPDAEPDAKDNGRFHVPASDVLITPSVDLGSGVPYVVGEVVLARYTVSGKTVTAYYPASVLRVDETSKVRVQFDDDRKHPHGRPVPREEVVRLVGGDLREAETDGVVDDLLERLGGAPASDGPGDDDARDDDAPDPDAEAGAAATTSAPAAPKVSPRPVCAAAKRPAPPVTVSPRTRDAPRLPNEALESPRKRLRRAPAPEPAPGASRKRKAPSAPASDAPPSKKAKRRSAKRGR